jgi:hypothetical protein
MSWAIWNDEEARLKTYCNNPLISGCCKERIELTETLFNEKVADKFVPDQTEKIIRGNYLY